MRMNQLLRNVSGRPDEFGEWLYFVTVLGYEGVAAADLSDTQRRLLASVASTYVGWTRDGHSEIQMDGGDYGADLLRQHHDRFDHSHGDHRHRH